MYRIILDNLKTWKNSKGKKPLLFRGARQVGKTFLARELSKEFDNYLEINFEKESKYKTIFDRDLDPKRIVRDLSVASENSIDPEKTLIFFDEIQECPRAITALRYFYEDMPGACVLAAGSLIEFAIEEVGVPVGRIDMLYVYPMSFKEFMLARNQNLLLDLMAEGGDISIHHEKLLGLLGEYLAIGGMPEAVQEWVNTSDFHKCRKIHRSIVETYKQDFSKYAKKHQVRYVELVFEAIPRMICKKFIYASVSKNHRSRELAPALSLLVKAQVAHIVQHSSGNGSPLAAEANPDKFKVISHDVAISQSILGSDYGEWIYDIKNALINRGPVVEAFVGQELLCNSDPNSRKKINYWVREKKSSLAEVDYLEVVNEKVIPIEVKCGTSRIGKSLALFLDEKPNSPYGFLLSTDSKTDLSSRIKQIPIYLIDSIWSKNFK